MLSTLEGAIKKQGGAPPSNPERIVTKHVRTMGS